MLEAFGFFVLMEAVGLAAAPLAALVLGRLPGAGLGFAKVLGVLLVGWLVWMAGSTGVADYGPLTILGAFLVVAALGALAAWRLRGLARRLREGGEEPPRGRLARWRRSRLAAQALPAEDPVRLRLWAGSEAVFAVSFARDGAADRVRARRLEHREADGRDADERHPGVVELPAAGRLDGGGDASTTTTSGTC